MSDTGTDCFGLSDSNRAIIQGILAPFSARLEVVAVFGSRAQGQYRPNSDLDLALYGNITETDCDRLWTLFQDSPLPFSVDIIPYNRINHPPLRHHIDLVARPLLRHNPDQGFIYVNENKSLKH
ncbi:nucleotidyltransferase family protein [Synechococcus sp. PCC 6312]|uniref:nucleotidyltransferase family protein n=1 Tax=Synechococcus sp. (strain ATCC 27167 / PCC 6312) TaxID=195253 RepID=UPI00029EF236|nr:nucleotidyltransferase domain-containing protein [Synechococcus sp. PCC 6312]AFY60257.1 putative nucleotidyltransferase [Synechococcus sp. PCC 6312]